MAVWNLRRFPVVVFFLGLALEPCKEEFEPKQRREKHWTRTGIILKQGLLCASSGCQTQNRAGEESLEVT